MGTATHYKKPKWRKQIEDMLRKYPRYKRSVQLNLVELFPSLTTSYSERVSGGQSEFISSTEKFGVKRAEQLRVVELVELSLEFLTPDEREVIEESYFTGKLPVGIICDRLGWSKRKYMYLKQSAIEKIAEALYLI